jgi:hypothetical protein
VGEGHNEVHGVFLESTPDSDVPYLPPISRGWINVHCGWARRDVPHLGGVYYVKESTAPQLNSNPNSAESRGLCLAKTFHPLPLAG